LPPLVPPASVAQPTREKSSSLPPRQLGSPPVVLVVLEVPVVELLVTAVAVVELPPAPLAPEPPLLLVLAVVPPEPLDPPAPGLPVVTPALVAVAVFAAAWETEPVVALALAVPLVAALAVVCAALLVLAVPLLLLSDDPPLPVFETVSDVEPPAPGCEPSASVPALQAHKQAASHGVASRTSVCTYVSMEKRCMVLDCPRPQRSR
jgi:hypothetical protein